MPNWAVNQLDISGDEKEIVQLIELVKGDEDAFDFAKVVPIPDSPFYAANETQSHFQCGCVPVYVELPDLPEVVAYTDNDGKEVMRKQGEWRVGDLPIRKITESNGTIEMDSALYFGGSEVCPIHEQLKVSSHPDWWYNWNVANWGTKWNCAEVWHDRDDDKPVEGKTSYNFDTAWSPAEPVVAALAKKFPTLTITHRYCEGGMGYAGQVVYLNGEVVSNDIYEQQEGLPDEAYLTEDDGSRSWERDYDKVPMTAFESFCEEHFGGIVGG
jgi:hypothetical protein